MLKVGFGKVDITPRVGVELCGFGPFLNRHSIGIRDRLWARAMALTDSHNTLVVVSCDLIGLTESRVAAIREKVRQTTGLGSDSIMVHCTHTHSGPATISLIGWGDPDIPYLEILPLRVAEACRLAVERMVPATLSHANVPCEGIGLNREYDIDAPPLDEVLQDNWRPAKPERTDTTCHVIKAVDSDGRLLGFCSYFGCHPVVCCQLTRYIPGDFAGVATNLLERENPGSVGLFLQGAQGDVNSCVVHKPEAESLLALDVIAGRYANAVRLGLRNARELNAPALRKASRQVSFSRIMLSREELQRLLTEKEAIVHADNASDSDHGVCMAAVYVVSLRRLLSQMDEGVNLAPPAEVQAFRIGDIALLGSPFEIFQDIKNDVVRDAGSPVPLVMGLTNGCEGYAPDRVVAKRGGYAAQMVPVMLGRLPFANIHEELSQKLIELDKELNT